MTEPTTSALTCPKCGGQMRSYERNGITIDQCADCRGMFLDRGELERLIEAEDVHYGGPSGGRPVQPEPSTGDPYGGRDPYYQQSGGSYDKHEGGKQHGGGKQQRRGGFLGDLLDF